MCFCCPSTFAIFFAIVCVFLCLLLFGWSRWGCWRRRSKSKCRRLSTWDKRPPSWRKTYSGAAGDWLNELVRVHIIVVTGFEGWLFELLHRFFCDWHINQLVLLWCLVFGLSSRVCTRHDSSLVLRCSSLLSVFFVLCCVILSEVYVRLHLQCVRFTSSVQIHLL